MNILSCDFSIDSPALTVLSLNERYDIVDAYFFNLQETIKYKMDTEHISINRFEKTIGNKIHDRTLQVWILVKDIIKKFNIEYVAIEGYAYGATETNNLTKQAELSGFIKICLYSYQRVDGTMGIPYLLLPPRTIKKYVSGDGNCDKEMMIEHFKLTKEFKQYFKDIDIKNLPSLNDICDSYWIGVILSNYLLYFKINNYCPKLQKQKLEWKSSVKSMSISETKMISLR